MHSKQPEPARKIKSRLICHVKLNTIFSFKSFIHKSVGSNITSVVSPVPCSAAFGCQKCALLMTFGSSRCFLGGILIVDQEYQTSARLGLQSGPLDFFVEGYFSFGLLSVILKVLLTDKNSYKATHNTSK